MPNDNQKPAGMFGDIKDSDFPSELIKANASFDAALSNCNIRDEQQRNDVIVYHAQLAMFGMVDEINGLTGFLNASISIGGYSRILATSAHVGMVYPSSLGVKLSKEGEKAWAEASMHNKRHREDGNNHNDE